MSEPQKPKADIFYTAHGKPYVEYLNTPGETREAEAIALRFDALEFPGEACGKELEAQIRGEYPGIYVTVVPKVDFPLAQEFSVGEIDKKEFSLVWRFASPGTGERQLADVREEFWRHRPVKLSGKDRVRWWSGWLHYPILIEDSKRQMEASLDRLNRLVTDGGRNPDARTRLNIIEEAYYEQVQRQRLAIYERRKENWRVIRWGATTALGLVLAFWSGLQIWDWFSKLIGD